MKLPLSRVTPRVFRRRLSTFQQYRDRLKAAPAQHVTSFLILHELTAIIPLPIVFLTLQHLDTPWDKVFDQETLEAGNKRMAKMWSYFGLEPLEKGSTKALNAAASYAIVKVLMPLRLAVSFALTPWFAKRFISPITSLFK